MTRDLNTATETASQAAMIHPVLFVKLEFPDGDVLVHSEIGDLTFDAETYTGVGILGNIGSVDEDSERARTPLALTLSGIPISMISVVLNQQYQGRPATLFLGYLEHLPKPFTATELLAAVARVMGPPEASVATNRSAAADRPREPDNLVRHR